MKTRPMFFFANEGAATGAPGSSGAAAVTTTITPPAAAGAGDGGGADDLDVLNYVPPSTDDISKFIQDGKESDAGPVGKTEAPKVEEKPAAKPEEKPGEKPPAKSEEPAPPAAQLRKRLSELEAEKTRLEGELSVAKSDKRVEELTNKLTAQEKAIADKEKAIAETERKLLVHNPLVSKRLVELRDKFNADYNSTLEIVPNLKGDYKGLVDEFASLPRGKDEYGQKLKDFRAKLREKFDDDAGTVFDAVRKGFDFMNNHAKLADEVQRDAERLEFEARNEEWSKSHESIDKQWNDWFTPPADAAATDPYNHNLFLQKFEAGMDKAEVERVNGALKSFVDRVFNGAQPRTAKDFPGMTEAQVREELGNIESRVAKDREDAKRILAVGAKLLTYFRPFIADWQKMKARAEGKAEGAPPDPTGKSGVAAKPGTAAAEDENSDIMDAEFKSAEEIAAEIAAG